MRFRFINFCAQPKALRKVNYNNGVEDSIMIFDINYDVVK